MINQEIEKLGLVDKPVTVVTDQFLTKSVEEANFQHHLFRNTGAKNLTYKNCDFSYCVFERAYFHGCNFINCKFVGARFTECNFRGATFDGCEFEYAVFSSTLISHKELLKNLPAWPNVKRELLRGLRINAERTGDAEAAKIFVREELSASREHLQKAREAKERYYAQKYKGFTKKIAVYLDSFWTWLDWHLWGHGEYPGRLIRTISIGLVAAALYRLYADQEVSGATSLTHVMSMFLAYFRDVCYAFLGVVPESFPIALASVLSLFRYVVLGLFISVLYKRLARR